MSRNPKENDQGKRHENSIKHWPKDERLRERLIKYRGDKLSDDQRLGILIGSGDRQSRKNALGLSLNLLNLGGSLNQLRGRPPKKFAVSPVSVPLRPHKSKGP